MLGEILLLSTVQKLLEFKIVSDKHVQKLVRAEIVALLNCALWDCAEGFADSLNDGKLDKGARNAREIHGC